MQARHGRFIAIFLGSLLSAAAVSGESGAVTDFADAVYRLKGLEQTAVNVRDLCAGSFPGDIAVYQKGYDEWRRREAPMLAEIESAYEQVVDAKAGGDPSERSKVLVQDAALATLSFEQAKKAFDATPKESLATKCNGYSGFLQGMNESAPYISTQLRILRSYLAGSRAESDRP